MEIQISEQIDQEMLTIDVNIGSKWKTVFCGNAWDFNRDGATFKKLFEELGHDVSLVQCCDEDCLR